MKEYTTETGFYVLVDSQDRIGALGNVPIGTHQIPDWVDLSNSFDVSDASDLAEYEIDSAYRPDQ